MRKLIIFLIFISLFTSAFAEKSPHGEKLKINCIVCHTTNEWKKIKTGEFNHNKTNFPLVGQHKTVGCKKCHPTLEFSKAKTDCSTCHADLHQGTVGQDCGQCHKPNSWIVTNLKQIHQQQGFSLIGAHASADCYRCHRSSSLLRFDNISTDCYACHKAKYDATTGIRNHKTLGFDTECVRCHNMTGYDWTTNGRGFDHGFFQLTGGHKISDCSRCHKNENENFKGLSSACASASCHLNEYYATKNPNHKNSGFLMDCQSCHSINSWVPATFDHESYFPIKSGRHSGISCATCHINSASSTEFTCVTTSCHGNAHHQNKGSNGCYSCHPKGKN